MISCSGFEESLAVSERLDISDEFIEGIAWFVK
jgi:hypothetical protein